MKKILLIMLFLLSLTAVALAAVNINTADVKELKSLPGIGWSRAAAIVDYRTEHGEFTTADDLKKVKGIGVKTLEKMHDQVTVGGKQAE